MLRARSLLAPTFGLLLLITTRLPQRCALARSRASAKRPNITWVAAFFPHAKHGAVASTASDLCRYSGGFSDSMSDCDHMTVAFNPDEQALNKMSKSFGTAVFIKPVAIAEDEHTAAVLLQVVQGPNSSISENLYPHATLLSSKYPYTPVYSNCLWERAINASGAIVTSGINGKPSKVLLPSGANVWNGVLPRGFCSDMGQNAFPATRAAIGLLTENAPVFQATLCSNNLWNRQTYRCNAIQR